MTSRRIVILLALVMAGATMLTVRGRRDRPPQPGHLAWIATARQFGPVGYRDPVGSISPDGRWIAYSEGRFLRVRAVGGGPILDLPAGESQIRHLAWSPDSRTIVADGFHTQAGWAVYDRVDRTRRALFPGRALRQLAWSRDGRSLAALVSGQEGQELWTVGADGTPSRVERMTHRVAFPAWTPDGEIACLATIDGKPRVTIPCGGLTVGTEPDLDVYGPLAFAPDGHTIYLSMANDGGTLDLWSAPIRGGRATRLTSFSRDTYAPSVAADGTVMFKVQNYRTVVSVSPAEGGFTQALAAFQSETPSWDPTGRWIGMTFGSWRRVVDDARYPDIAQDAGIIAADASQPAQAPAKVAHASASEDQALCWSPNGKWIAFHSHKDQSDDIWLRPAAGDAVPPRRISFLGRGAETGWPRWSRDGRWLLFDGANRATGRSVMYVVGLDQESGAVTSEVREVPVSGVEGEISHAEWLPDGGHVIALVKEAPGRHVIFTTSREGGAAEVVHRFESEHDAPGLTVSPDGREVAFIAPASDGFFQVFRMSLTPPVAGVERARPVQVTRDPSNKTQPAWSPDGRRLAFTVWGYDVQFWTLR